MANRSAVTMVIAIFSVALLSACHSSKQMGGASGEQIRSAINEDRWIFNARTANPQVGRTRFLNPPDFVKVSRDTLESALSYFGRAYSGADVLTNQSVLNFTTTRFQYLKQQNNKGGWMITFTLKDNPQIQSLVFEIFENGSGSLNVTLTNRSPISFSGTIEPRK
jgi:hypothetical protein